MKELRKKVFRKCHRLYLLFHQTRAKISVQKIKLFFQISCIFSRKYAMATITFTLKDIMKSNVFSSITLKFHGRNYRWHRNVV